MVIHLPIFILSLVFSAPTGCGKTVILEFAILRLMMSVGQKMKSLYIPTKALFQQRCAEWTKKFSAFGVRYLY